jgi:hypothetical protein
MTLTRREKIVLAIAALVFVISMLVEQRALNRFEWPFILLFIPAVAWYLFTDPQRKKAG